MLHRLVKLHGSHGVLIFFFVLRQDISILETLLISSKNREIMKTFYRYTYCTVNLPSTVPAKSLDRSEKLNICLPEIDTPLKKVFLKKDYVLLFWVVFHLYNTKTFHLAAVYLKVNPTHFLSH